MRRLILKKRANYFRECEKMNEQLELRLLKYKTIKKNIKECENGYSLYVDASLHGDYTTTYQKVKNHYVIILGNGRGIIDTKSVVHTSDEAKNACYQELLKYAYKKFHVDEELILGENTFVYRNKDGERGCFMQSMPWLFEDQHRQDEMAKYQARRYRKQNGIRTTMEEYQAKHPRKELPETIKAAEIPKNKSLLGKIVGIFN
jgi:hypothetical protein